MEAFANDPAAQEAAKEQQAKKPANRAEDLFADWYGEEDAPASPAEPEPEALAAVAAAKAEAEAESSDDSDDSGTMRGTMQGIDVSQLQDLLRDQGVFFEACEGAVVIAAGSSGQQPRTTHQWGQQYQELQEMQRRLSEMESGQQQQQQQHHRPVLNNPEELKLALNTILRRCEMELVDDAEARDLFVDVMDAGVFYQVAREYFSTLCRTLTMAV